MELNAAFWGTRYATGDTGWDLGAVSPPLRTWFDGFPGKELRILIPGGGRSWEAEYLHRKGFRHVHVVDLTDASLQELTARCPDFPREHFHIGDFFAHAGRYDRIVEQTFFCALDPVLRKAYVEKMHGLLVPGGILGGVLFNDPLNLDHPPFGGSLEVYRKLFAPVFADLRLEPCRNSVAPRAGRELWLRARRSFA